MELPAKDDGVILSYREAQSLQISEASGGIACRTALSVTRTPSTNGVWHLSAISTVPLWQFDRVATAPGSRRINGLAG